MWSNQPNPSFFLFVPSLDNQKNYGVFLEKQNQVSFNWIQLVLITFFWWKFLRTLLTQGIIWWRCKRKQYEGRNRIKCLCVEELVWLTDTPSDLSELPSFRVACVVLYFCFVLIQLFVRIMAELNYIQLEYNFIKSFLKLW